MNNNKKRQGQWQAIRTAGTASLALAMLSACSGGTGASSSVGSGSNSTLAVNAAPSVPQFSGAAQDASFINTALANAGMSLTPPATTTIVYVAPPTSYASAGTSQIGSGTQADPYRNLIAVVNSATAGEHIYLEPGTYEMYSMAQAFGEPQSWLAPATPGTQSAPIVIETDPAALNWATSTVATIDFQLQPAAPTVNRPTAINLPDWWDFENIEVKNALDRIFWVAGSHDLIYHNDLHHVELVVGMDDNVGIIGIMRRTGGNYNDFIIGNNIHDINAYDSSGNPTAYTGDTVNLGCTYSETDQWYTTFNSLSAAGIGNVNSLTQAQLAAYTAPPDDNVYFYANEMHNCINGIGTKLAEYGPWFMLSNVIYGVQNGIKMTMSGTVANPSLVRNNIIYNAANSGGYQLQTGIIIGFSQTDRTLGDADNVAVMNNTIINANVTGTSLWGGFNDVVNNNVFVTTTTGVAHIVYAGGYIGGSGMGGGGGTNTALQYFNGGGTWPGVEGEYLFPVNASNPYYASMPDYLQGTGWSAITFNGNLYLSTPTVHLAGTPSISPNLNSTTIDTNPTVMPWSVLSPLFNNAALDDYRAGPSPGILATVGSQMP